MEPRCHSCKKDICEHTYRLDVENERDAAYFMPDLLEREDLYGQFLHDGDFEKYQHLCYIERGTEKYDLAVIESICETLRALWIRNRLTDFGSPEWAALAESSNHIYKQLLMLRMMYERKYNKPYTHYPS